MICAIGGASSEALFVGPAPGFAGFDQVNVRLPRSLAGRGEVDVALSVEGKAANTVRVSSPTIRTCTGQKKNFLPPAISACVFA